MQVGSGERTEGGAGEALKKAATTMGTKGEEQQEKCYSTENNRESESESQGDCEMNNENGEKSALETAQNAVHHTADSVKRNAERVKRCMNTKQN